MNKRQIRYLLPGLVIGFIIIIIFGCAEKIIDNGRGGQEVQVVLKWTSNGEMSTSRPTFLTVTAPDIPAPIIDTLIDDGNFISGTLLVPAGRDRKFLLEVIVPYPGNEAAQVVIYRGETTTDIIPGTINKVDIVLYPSAPMLKLTPRFTRTILGQTNALDIKVYQMDNLGSININLNVDPPNTYFDSIVRGPGFFGDSDFTSWYDGAVAGLSISRPNQPDLPIVDHNGYATLATAYIRSLAIDSGKIIDTNWIYVNGYNIIRTTGDTITRFYTEGATVEIYPNIIGLK
jgi:hypothetical protein